MGLLSADAPRSPGDDRPADPQIWEQELDVGTIPSNMAFAWLPKSSWEARVMRDKSEVWAWEEELANELASQLALSPRSPFIPRGAKDLKEHETKVETRMMTRDDLRPRGREDGLFRTHVPMSPRSALEKRVVPKDVRGLKEDWWTKEDLAPAKTPPVGKSRPRQRALFEDEDFSAGGGDDDGFYDPRRRRGGFNRGEGGFGSSSRRTERALSETLSVVPGGVGLGNWFEEYGSDGDDSTGDREGESEWWDPSELDQSVVRDASGGKEGVLAAAASAAGAGKGRAGRDDEWGEFAIAAKAKAAESARKRRDADAARIEAEREAWRAEMDAAEQAEEDEAEAARAALSAPATPERSPERSPGGRASASMPNSPGGALSSVEEGEEVGSPGSPPRPKTAPPNAGAKAKSKGCSIM
jgi:hypothetical protein